MVGSAAWNKGLLGSSRWAIVQAANDGLSGFGTAGKDYDMELGGDKRTRGDIEKFGCTVMHVLAEGKLPPFAYSIGIQQQSAAPEALVIGLKRPTAHFVVNTYNSRVRAGERFAAGQFYAGFVEGLEVAMVSVPHAAYAEYLGQSLDFYGGPAFDVLQIVYPSAAGAWPWTVDADASFRQWQPVLGRFERA